MEVVTIVTLIVIALLSIRFFVRPRSQLSDLSGPKPLPIIGNILDIRATSTSTTTRITTLEKWAKQYGPVFLVRVFFKELVFVSGYDELIEMLVTKGKAFGARPQHYRLQMLFHGKDVLFGSPADPLWMPLRKAAHRAVRHYGDGLNRLEHLLANQMASLVSKLAKYEGKEVDLLSHVQSSMAKATITMQTCQPIEDDDPVIACILQLEMIRDCISPFTRMELDHMPWLRHFGHPTFKKLKQCIAMLDTLWVKFRKMAEETYSSDDIPSCTINAILQLGDPKSPYYESGIDEQYQKGLFLDLFLASLGSTVQFTHSFFNVLLNHPHVLQKFREELDRVVGRDRAPSIRDKEALPYANATILEAMRYLSTVPLTGHWTLEDTSVGGRPIPKDTLVLPLFTALHHDERYWGDPWNMRPERFLNADGSLQTADHPNRKHLMAFGAGFRVCCGEVFAMKRVFMFTTSIVHAFDLKAGEKLVSCDPKTFKDGLTITQPTYYIRLIPRED